MKKASCQKLSLNDTVTGSWIIIGMLVMELNITFIPMLEYIINENYENIMICIGNSSI